MSPCARCGFELSDSATKCLFCGHVVGAALPPSAGPSAESSRLPASDPGGRIPRPTIPYRRPDDLDVEAASTPPVSPLSRPAFGAEPTPAPIAHAAPQPAVDAPAVDAAVDPAVDAAAPAAAPLAATAPSRVSLTTTLVIAALVGAIAGGLGFLIFIALHG